MQDAAEVPIARVLPGLLPVADEREPLRVVIASLALGGAERIVIEWLAAEAACGRACELAVLHARRKAWSMPRAVEAVASGDMSPVTFMHYLGKRWHGARAPLSTHLVNDGLLRILWRAGLRTVPVIHNSREGWRNDPRTWPPESVPYAVACAETVRAAILDHGCRVPVITLRHRPQVRAAAFDPAERQRVRAELGVAPDTLLVLAVGAIKPQKDYPRAIEVLGALAARRDAVLVIVGGVLDHSGLAELDRVIDAACAGRVSDRLRLPGFVDPVEPYYAAADVLLNVSRHEGLSMAVREALAAGVPVVASDVGGQREIVDERMHLLPRDTPAPVVAAALDRHCSRAVRTRNAQPRLARGWSLTTAWPQAHCHDTETLFITANLNAGGAQRSLVNLALPLSRRHRIAVAVCAESTQPAFARTLEAAGVRTFRPAIAADPCTQAQALLAWAGGHGVRTLCFWNVDAKVKLLLARFAPVHVRLIDVSPGHYAFEELEAAAPWSEAIDFAPRDFYVRLDALVLKYHGGHIPVGVKPVVIPNGVELRLARGVAPLRPRFLVSGRIAPSKRLAEVLAAFSMVRARHADAELHVVGTAEPRYKAYAQAILAQAHGSAVLFRGAIPGLEFLAEPFTAALVLGTHQGSPNAVLEAMSAGIPVIANASGGTGEIVRDGQTGWLLREDCGAIELARAMCEAIADRALNHRLGISARAFVAAHHGMASMVEKYLTLLVGPGSMRDSGVQQTLAGNEIGLDADAVGVLEEH